MKIKLDDALRLAEKIEARRCELGLTYTQVASLSNVDTSQVNRVCHGQFRTINPSVVQICNSLGLSAGDAGPVASPKLVRALASLWDGTSADEERLIQLFELLGKMKGGATIS
ncbi:transcriptional regulator with XRE-family HTH domain [Rhizobium aethiopicum]|uniref:helix-turn-helix domain-containing protein n=1 Tax=Rhizobium aethiopicum TaxID=1138170 RepID=UPI001615999A|nr:helix-turn-helix transcriptional regulator [Rhizobium aethiopicum]MBB4581514.1 transcriptional regulator with XRE-family HTH domain [Rhizobium aethiopicum]